MNKLCVLRTHICKPTFASHPVYTYLRYLKFFHLSPLLAYNKTLSLCHLEYRLQSHPAPSPCCKEGGAIGPGVHTPGDNSFFLCANSLDLWTRFRKFIF